jgi:tetratricopeptide (TPR) repeat protein
MALFRQEWEVTVSGRTALSRYWIVCLGILAVAGSALGQRFTVSGRVFYENGSKPADMVTVTLRNFTEMGFEQTNTDVHGNFSFSVPRGVYYVSVRLSGYAEASERVEVGVFSTSGITLYLRPLPPRLGEATTPASGAVDAKYLRIPESARSEYEQGMKLFRGSGKLEEGLVHLRKAVEIHPRFALAHYGTGLLLMDLNQMDDARASFAQAVAEDEELVHAYFPLGAILNFQKEHAQAEKILRKGLVVRDDIWQLHFELARAVAYQGRWPEAEAIAERAAQLNDKAEKVQLLLANIYFELGKDNEALDAAERFLKLAPDDPIAPQIRARVQQMRPAKPPL